jgi:hypothetical protein
MSPRLRVCALKTRPYRRRCGQPFNAEAMLAVMIALDETPLTQCVGLDGDDNGVVTINELIGAVDEALNG